MVVKVHFYLFALISYMFFAHKLDVFLLFYISVLIHEIAHIVIALSIKVNVNELLLMPFGVCASYSGIISPIKEIIISIAGPLMSFIIAIWSRDFFVTNINLLIMMLNLIPIYPLDGGRIQKNFFILIYGYNKGLKISQIISDFFITLVFLLSIILIVFLKNFYLLFLSLYIYTLSKKEMKKERILGLINYLQNG